MTMWMIILVVVGQEVRHGNRAAKRPTRHEDAAASATTGVSGNAPTTNTKCRCENGSAGR